MRKQPTTPLIRDPYTPFAAKRLDASHDGMTDQSQAKDCDVNVIMDRFMKTGQLPAMIQGNPEYGDFSDPVEYQEALNRVRHAEEQFAALNAKIRGRFDNDPAQFLAFATDPKNGEEMVKLGLASPRAEDPVLGQMKALREDLKSSGRPSGGPKPAEEPDAAKRHDKS